MQAFENLDARAVARLVLAVVGTKTDSVGFLGQVMEAVSNGPDSSEALPEEEQRKPKGQSEGRKDPPRTEKRKEPPSGGSEPKRHNSSLEDDLNFFEADVENEQGAMFFLVPNVVVGAIIGKAGITLKSMQRKTGANVQVEKNSGLDVRMISCVGTLRQATIAAYQVMDVANLDSVHLLVPNAICGMIIGKAGANIKKLERETGAQLKMEPENEAVRTVLVGGEPRKRSHAMYLIASLISANVSRIGPFDPRRLNPSGPPPGGPESRGPPQRDNRNYRDNRPHDMDMAPPPLNSLPPNPYQDMGYNSNDRMPMQRSMQQEDALLPAANNNLMTQQHMLQQMASLQQMQSMGYR